MAHFKGGQNYTEIVAGRLEGGTPAMSSLWRSLLLRAGVRAVVDDEGVGLIHTSEKIQLCVLDPAIIRVISRFDNKTPARGAAPKSPEQMKRDIQNAKDTSIIRQADLVDLVDNANKWANLRPRASDNQFYDKWFEDYYSEYEQNVNFQSYYDSVKLTAPCSYVPVYFSKQSVEKISIDPTLFYLDFVIDNECNISDDDYHLNEIGHRLFVDSLLPYVTKTL